MNRRTGTAIQRIADTLSDAESPIDALHTLAALDQLTGDLMGMYARRARAMGETWVTIAKALDVTPQAAQQRFGH